MKQVQQIKNFMLNELLNDVANQRDISIASLVDELMIEIASYELQTIENGNALNESITKLIERKVKSKQTHESFIKFLNKKNHC